MKALDWPEFVRVYAAAAVCTAAAAFLFARD